MNFNINHYVWVKLTQVGLDELERLYNEVRSAIGSDFPKWKPPTTENGYTRFQFWILMSKFGHMMGMGFDQPFEMNIIIEEEDLE